MKEVHIKVSNISQKQWTNLLIELNLVKDAWQRFGPEINIKAKNLMAQENCSIKKFSKEIFDMLY